MIKTYRELSAIEDYVERFRYLQITSTVGLATFGFDRYLNQMLYQDSLWKKVRDKVIIRDNGCDMGHKEHPIAGKIIVHHMNPLTIDDVLQRSAWVFEPDFLICVSDATHRAIHYGNEDMLVKDPVDRKPNDTCPWKR